MTAPGPGYAMPQDVRLSADGKIFYVADMAANGIWLMKWSRDGGDLRVAHFFGTHAMQVLPLLTALLPARAPHRVPRD
jgi:sugar lactone lactonase YvrE